MQGKQKRPDIVLLVLDSQRADFLSSYGNPRLISPHLSDLATRAIQYNRAIAPAQWTVPSHASIFSGQYPWQHSVTDLDRFLPANMPTVSERLNSAGYHCTAFSNNPLVGVLQNGLMRGFGEVNNYSMLLSARNTVCHEYDVRAEKPVHQNPIGKLRSQFRQRILRTQEDLFSPAMTAVWYLVFKLRGTLKGNTGASLQDAASFLAERTNVRSEQPVYCFINLMGTHVPYDPPPWALEKHVPELGHVHWPAVKLWILNTSLYQQFGVLPRPLSPALQSLIRNLYQAEVAAQDRQVGWFIDKLRQSGRLANTLLIITADHGDHLGERGLLGHDLGAYQPLLHVPLIIKEPADRAGIAKQVDSIISTRRIYHTILACAGIAKPSEEALSLINGNSDPVEEPLTFASASPTRATIHRSEKRHPGLLSGTDFDQAHLAVFRDHHKLIMSGENPVGLYNPTLDPHERVDLKDSQPHRLLEMIEQLQDTAIDGPQIDHESGNLDFELNQRLRALGY
jgi:arylsulfatase A-like enzyme